MCAELGVGDDPAAQAGDIDDVAVFAALLGGVHGEVGVAQQGVELVARFGHRDADAGADQQFVALGPDGRGEQLADALGGPDGVVDLHPVQQCGELVTAEAGDDVAAAERRAQASGDGGQGVIADGVPEGVVDELEVVQVDEQHRDGLVHDGAGDSGVHDFAEPGTVDQPGEGVV